MPSRSARAITEYVRVCAIRPVTRTCHNVTCKKGKRKFLPRTGHEGPEGEHRYNYTLSLTSALDGGWVVNATPRPLYPRERRGTPCTGGWVGPRAGLDGCRKSRPTGVRSPDRPACSESLYRLSYPGPR